MTYWNVPFYSTTANVPLLVLKHKPLPQLDNGSNVILPFLGVYFTFCSFIF